jgi:hypothetical protein
MKNLLCALTMLGVLNPALAECMSHSTEIPANKTVCFAKSMRQYSCSHRNGEWGLEFSQKLSMRSSLNDKDICWHVDSYNERPATEQLLSLAAAPRLAALQPLRGKKSRN